MQPPGGISDPSLAGMYCVPRNGLNIPSSRCGIDPLIGAIICIAYVPIVDGVEDIQISGYIVKDRLFGSLSEHPVKRRSPLQVFTLPSILVCETHAEPCVRFLSN